MFTIATKMLFGDRAKYLGLVFGVMFATLLITQQVTLFIGIMLRSGAIIFSVPSADIWVMDTRVRYLEEIEPLRDIELSKIRSVPGVLWAVPFYKGLAIIRMPDGLSQQVQLIGVDDASLVGICPKMKYGDERSIQGPSSVLMDINGYKFTWPNMPITLPKAIELNDHRLFVDGLCEPQATFYTFPLMYIAYDKLSTIMPPARNRMSFVLVKAAPGVDVQELKQRIADETHLQALTGYEFAWRSINYLLTRTAIPINFGVTIGLGIIIGAAITAQTFYIFVVENLRQFAALKAIGVTNRQLFRLVLTQASIVGFVGYSFGISLTALFLYSGKDIPSFKGFILHWQVAAGSAVLIATIILLSISLSLRKVFKIDPAIVFRG
jgi:putative ABC transport system permease protein